MKIERLDHRALETAEKMYAVFQRSYRKEADLIGIEDFPPLRRTAEDLMASGSQFFGVQQDSELAAVVEVTDHDAELDICSLVVDPAFFRRGYASRLLRFVLDTLIWQTAVVETAAVNDPAIALYRKVGFVEEKRWTPGHGIPKVLLRLRSKTV